MIGKKTRCYIKRKPENNNYRANLPADQQQNTTIRFNIGQYGLMQQNSVII
jgi:hypothetical protein